MSVLKVPPNKRMFNDDYDDKNNNNNNNNKGCRILGLVACSILINIRDVFKEIILGFVAHAVDIS